MQPRHGWLAVSKVGASKAQKRGKKEKRGESEANYRRRRNAERGNKIKGTVVTGNKAREGRDNTANSKASPRPGLKSASKMLLSLEPDRRSSCWSTPGSGTLPRAPRSSAPGAERAGAIWVPRHVPSGDNAALGGTRPSDSHHQGLGYVQQGSGGEKCPSGQGQENHSRCLLGEGALS